MLSAICTFGTYVVFDGDTGALIKLFQPTGEHTGNTIDSWLALRPAHGTRVRQTVSDLVCVLGLAIVMLSITGVYVWLKKRNARRISQEKHALLDKGATA